MSASFAWEVIYYAKTVSFEVPGAQVGVTWVQKSLNSSQSGSQHSNLGDFWRLGHGRVRGALSELWKLMEAVRNLWKLPEISRDLHQGGGQSLSKRQDI